MLVIRITSLRNQTLKLSKKKHIFELY